MNHLHKFTYDENNGLLHLTCRDVLTLENSIAFLTEVVNHRNYPDHIYILLDQSQAELKISMTEIHILEAFQRKYIDNFKSVKIAITLPQSSEKAMLGLYYEAIINNQNCESKVFDHTQYALKWLATSN